MTKKAVTLRLSEVAIERLKEQANRKRKSQAEVVELALREMAPSTPEEVAEVVKARRRAFERVVKEYGLPKTKKEAFVLYKRAHTTGFYHYQFRHAVSEYEDAKDDNDPTTYVGKINTAYLRGIK